MGFLLQFFDVHSFNSQPPEGGWSLATAFWLLFKSFQLTAARRRLGDVGGAIAAASVFQLTAARRRLVTSNGTTVTGRQFQLTAARRRLVLTASIRFAFCWFQLTAARRRLAALPRHETTRHIVSTHSRPKAAGSGWHRRCWKAVVSTHSRPKAAGYQAGVNSEIVQVSTHSRPKAAGVYRPCLHSAIAGFNSQPPEGGWWLVAL